MTSRSLAKLNMCSPDCAPREHHPDAVPGEQDRRERQEQPIADADELRFLGVAAGVVMACWTVPIGS